MDTKGEKKTNKNNIQAISDLFKHVGNRIYY